jgi:hypothetical protein
MSTEVTQQVMADLQQDIRNVNETVAKTFEQCERLHNLEVNIQISLQQALAAEEIRNKGFQVQLLSALSSMSQEFHGSLGKLSGAMTTSEAVVHDLAQASHAHLDGISSQLSSIIRGELQRCLTTDGALGPLQHLEESISKLSVKLEELSKTTGDIWAFVRQSSMMVKILMTGRRNMPTLALVLPEQ